MARPLGFEIPEQLGALFIGDASYLAELTRGQPPLSDDRPKRIQITAPREERDALLWQWRDTPKARERFSASPLIARLWPSELRAPTERQFENQRLLNDLLFPDKTPVRQMQVLHQVLHSTRLQLPVLLLLNSDPDIQRMLAVAPESERARSEWQLDRLAGTLAERDFAAALPLVRSIPPERLPFPDLAQYVEYVVRRGRDRAP
jgi:hypothetical protein